MSQGRRERILDEAAQWMALLQSGHAGAEERLAFQQWRQADAEHGAVFDRLSLGLQSFRDEPLHGLRAEQLIGALEAPSARRRFLQRSLALAAFGVATLALGRIGIVGFPWPGDLYTGTGQRQSFRLEDGSQLVLDARSRVRPNSMATGVACAYARAACWLTWHGIRRGRSSSTPGVARSRAGNPLPGQR
ncbi:putative histidinol dehydrogenase [Pseudomonas aeruginosa]|nr:putative histidinol dehydrogenase [Pseudomonas aeruginosa]